MKNKTFKNFWKEQATELTPEEKLACQKLVKADGQDNPWAICTAAVGRDSPKYESCVLHVKEGFGKMGTEAAGPIPRSGLAAQDLETKRKRKSVKTKLFKEYWKRIVGKVRKQEASKLDVLLDRFIADEKMGEQEYRDMATELEGTPLASDFESMADDEASHKETLVEAKP
jgi:hypothetical protein